MVFHKSSSNQTNTRLVNLLAEVSQTKLSSSNHNLAERLGNLIGLSGSVALARVLQQLPHITDVDKSGVYENVLEDTVLKSRAKMIEQISESFSHTSHDTQAKVPSADPTVRLEALQSFEVYRKFYAALQLEMAVCVQNLRVQARASLVPVSAELHQLAELDKTLEESLLGYNRKLFNVTLKVLERRFKFLLKTHLQSSDEQLGETSEGHLETWLAKDAWLSNFYQDMHQLLLAEFDVRLQPVLGLLEALNEKTKQL